MFVVIGNGESRKDFNLDLLLNHITYGCNAMYRDWAPTNLICIDNKMLHELVTSDYPKLHQCWFRNFQLLDSDMYPVLRSTVSSDIEVIENENTSFKFAYYGQEISRVFHDDTHTMDLEEKPCHWFTWVSEEDKINVVDDLKHIPLLDSGPLATWFCCENEKPEKVYFMGFDFNINNGKVNNIYKDTYCYAPSYALPVKAKGWIQNFEVIFTDHFPEVDFIHVQEEWCFNKEISNIDTISINEFKELL